MKVRTIIFPCLVIFAMSASNCLLFAKSVSKRGSLLEGVVHGAGLNTNDKTDVQLDEHESSQLVQEVTHVLETINALEQNSDVAGLNSIITIAKKIYSEYINQYAEKGLTEQQKKKVNEVVEKVKAVRDKKQHALDSDDLSDDQRKFLTKLVDFLDYVLDAIQERLK